MPSPRALLPEHCTAASKRKVAIQFTADHASAVVITGSFSRWSEQGIALRRVSDGTWMAELELEPGRHEYRFIVDGVWTNGPSADGYAPNPFGGLNTLLYIN